MPPEDSANVSTRAVCMYRGAVYRMRHVLGRGGGTLRHAHTSQSYLFPAAGTLFVGCVYFSCSTRVVATTRCKMQQLAALGLVCFAIRAGVFGVGD